MSHYDDRDFIPNSFQVPNVIIDEYMCKMSPNAFKVYMVMVRKTKGWNKTSDSLSQSQIMQLTGIVSDNTVRKAIAELIGFELIIERKAQGRQSHFYVSLRSYVIENEDLKLSTTPANFATPSIIDPLNNCGTTTAKNAEQPPQKMRNTPSNIADTKDTIQKTIKTINKKQDISSARKNDSDVSANDLLDSIEPELRKEWLGIRKAKKQPTPTPRAMKVIQAEAEQVGLTLEQAIEFACDNGWAGFKASWYTNANQTSNPAITVAQAKAMRNQKPSNHTGFADKDYSVGATTLDPDDWAASLGAKA